MAGDVPYAWSAGTIVPVKTVEMAARIASDITRYEVPNPLPTALVLTSAEMDAMLPGNYGLVRYKDSTKIFLNVDIPSDTRFAVLVHEMVHIMQIRAGLAPADCLSSVANELEAYSAGTRYLAAAGIHIPITVALSCP